MQIEPVAGTLLDIWLAGIEESTMDGWGLACQIADAGPFPIKNPGMLVRCWQYSGAERLRLYGQGSRLLQNLGSKWS